MVERERRFPNSCSLPSQEKNNAGFGRNEGTLVVLAEPSTQGKVALLQSGSSRRRPVWKGAGRDPSHQRAAIAFDEDTSRGHQRQLEFISGNLPVPGSCLEVPNLHLLIHLTAEIFYSGEKLFRR